MHLRNINYRMILILSVIGISLICLSGIVLDKIAEQRIHKMYTRDDKGVINGVQSFNIINNKKNAIILVHGFSDSPALFADLVNDIKLKVNSDIYVPLLPFHGRNLESMAQFNNKIILDSLAAKINAISDNYSHVTVVGISYGGALLTKLVSEKKIKDSVKVILYAPAFYIISNNTFNRFLVHIYGWWRKYCNYAALGCEYPSHVSGDAVASPMFDKEKSLQYIVAPALLQLYQFDLDNRHELSNIHRPYSIIMAKDDNRVSYIKIRTICKANPQYCKLYSFSSGRHIIHWGANKKRFESLLIKLENEL